MNGLTFAQPAWLWGAVLIVPLAALRLWAHLRAGGRLPGLVSPRLAHRLINGATQSRRWTIFCLQALALLGIFAALSRPQLGFEEIESETEARNLLIAIDTSRSMLSDDLPPNRLSRTKLAAKDIVLSLPDDRIGLVAFAGKPFLQAPLTVDHEAILEAIDQLDTEIIPRGGTNLSAAVNLALETVEEAKLGPSALVLFSDGEALEGLDEVENVRERAEKAGLKLLAVGVGTSGGSIIPAVNEDGEPIPGEFVKDENGQVVRTRLTPESLQALAAKGGVYFHLGGSASLTEVVSRIREHLAATREEAGTQRRPIERFLWPLSVAFGLLVLSHLAPLFWLKPVRKSASPSPTRRSMAALILFLFSLVPGQLPAESVPGVAAKATEAMEATERALAEESSPRKRSFLQMQIGAQAYRAGNFEKAAEAFGSALAEGRGRYDSTALYNLGNTLFRRGETALTPRQNPDEVQSLTGNAGIETTIRDWEGAIEHFESSLALEPGNQMAAHNLDYVKQRLEELKKQQEQQEQQNQQQEDQKEKEQQKQEDQKDQQDQNKQDQKDQQDQNQDKNPSSKDPSEGNQDPQKEPGKDGQDPQSDDQNPNPENNTSDQPQESKDSGQDQKNENSSGQQPQPDPSEMPQDSQEKPSDGKLEANPNQAQPQGSPNHGNPARSAELQKNPETGYAPTEARQLLDALADETEVRPLLAPSRGEKFKNW